MTMRDAFALAFLPLLVIVGAALGEVVVWIAGALT